MIRSEVMSKIQLGLHQLTAAQAADLLLSPNISEVLLNEATREEGPSMWIVNRSDVYDESLLKLASHPLDAISSRAQEKLSARKSSLTLLSPPEIPDSFEEIEHYAVEDLLGHPLCPFEGMIYFSRSVDEDQRASSCLSLTRRLLEHPPNWSLAPDVKIELQDHFSRILLEDASPYVRAYAARIPILPKSVLSEAVAIESDDFVRGRILQNPALQLKDLEKMTQILCDQKVAEFFTRRILAFDERLPSSHRVALMKVKPDDELSTAVHEWHLSCS